MRRDTASIGSPAAICIRAPNWVGDVVMATPLFRCVRSGFPDARILLIIRDRVAEVLRGADWFDERLLYCAPPHWGARAAREFFRCARRIRQTGCELGLALPHSFNSALMLFMAGARRRVGYARDLRRWLLTDAADRPMTDGRFRPTYMADYYLALCEMLGLSVEDRRTTLPFAEEDRQAVRPALERAGVDPARSLFLLHAAAGFGPSKLWPEERFAALAGMLQREFGAQIACIGGQGAGPGIGRIAEASEAHVADLSDCGIGLHLLKALVAHSDLLVTTDSGPRHYGVALGVPTVCVMGPTDPAYSTSDRPNDRVVRVDVECGPCQEKVCGLDHRCMDRITPEMVLAECRKALRVGGRGAQL